MDSTEQHLSEVFDGLSEERIIDIPEMVNDLLNDHSSIRTCAPIIADMDIPNNEKQYAFLVLGALGTKRMMEDPMYRLSQQLKKQQT